MTRKTKRRYKKIVRKVVSAVKKDSFPYKMAIFITVFFLCYGFIQSRRTGFILTDPFDANSMIYIDDNGNKLYGYQSIEDEVYYFNEDTGKMNRGNMETQKGIQNFTNDGRLLTGLQKQDGKTIFYNQDGYQVKNAFVRLDDKTRLGRISYFDKDGYMVTGKTKIKGQDYKFDKEGNIVSDFSNLQKELEDIVENRYGEVSIYFKDLRSQKSFSINDHNYYPCCMIKTVALAEVYNQIEQGNIDYKENQKYIEDMIIISDNTSYNVLMKLAGLGNGLQGLNQANHLAYQIGMENTGLHHALQPGKELFSDGGANTSTAGDIGIFFDELYKGNIVSKKSSLDMIQLLERCEDDEALAQGFPKNIPFAHKTGCAETSYHDGGIIYAPDRPYILVVFTKDSLPCAPLFEQISETVYDYEMNCYPDFTNAQK